MKFFAFLLAASSACFMSSAAHAAELRNAGILGNSGEQGATLVRFGEKQAMGLGVVHDSQGGLWDRGGDGALNRYALDGRLLGTWRIPAGRLSHLKDGILLIGDTLLFKDDRKLCTLPLNASPGTAPKVLPGEVTHLSTRAHDGWAVAANESGKVRQVFLVNLAGERRPIATLATPVFSVEMGPEGGVYAQVLSEDNNQNEIRRLDAGAPADARGPWPHPGGRIQWLTGHWFGVADHGTLRRFSPDFKPAPGVILGGASGSFIGYVPCNYEIESANGLAHLGGNLYAVSGRYGVMHLLQWQPTERRFEIIRRIGALQSCPSLGLDDQGRVWCHSGVWQWSEGPDAPLQHGVPPPTAPGAFAMMSSGEDEVFAVGTQNDNGMWFVGKLDGPVRRFEVGSLMPKDSVAAALVTWENKKRALLTMNPAGKGVAIYVDLGNKTGRTVAGQVELQAQTPLTSLTTLATTEKNGLVAAADGHFIEFTSGPGNTWKESRRWNSWGDGKDTFGSNIRAASSQGRLWVSDSGKHRVLCFDLSAAQPTLLAAFGATGTSGDDLSHLDTPAALAANGDRAVVYDSGNQRLVKLKLVTGSP